MTRQYSLCLICFLVASSQLPSSNLLDQHQNIPLCIKKTESGVVWHNLANFLQVSCKLMVQEARWNQPFFGLAPSGSDLVWSSWCWCNQSIIPTSTIQQTVCFHTAVRPSYEKSTSFVFLYKWAIFSSAIMFFRIFLKIYTSLLFIRCKVIACGG